MIPGAGAGAKSARNPQPATRATLDALAAIGPIPREIMPQWQWRHVLLAQSPGDRLIDDTIVHFTAARFATGARASNADPAPVFIVGMPRSGATVCEQILAANPPAYGAGERIARGLARWRIYAAELAPLIAELAQEDALDGWEAAPPR